MRVVVYEVTVVAVSFSQRASRTWPTTAEKAKAKTANDDFILIDVGGELER